MITTADKLDMVTWAFSLFSVLIVLLIALSWYRKKRLSLFNKAAILIVLVGRLRLPMPTGSSRTGSRPNRW